MTDTGLVSFAAALEAVKQGHRARRVGWNGKGMFVFIQKGSIEAGKYGFTEPPVANHPSTMNGVSFGLFELGDKGTVTRMPCVCLQAADGSIVTGWTASQVDMLAVDWEVLS